MDSYESTGGAEAFLVHATNNAGLHGTGQYNGNGVVYSRSNE